MAEKAAVTDTKTSVKEQKFTKQQLYESRRYAKRRDLVEALLDDGKQYSVKEVDSLIESYFKKGVK